MQLRPKDERLRLEFQVPVCLVSTLLMLSVHPWTALLVAK